MSRLTLYQRDECHLCELAWEVLARAGVAEFDSVFIDGEAELEQRYGLRVPVLGIQGAASAAVRELDWPFDADQVRAALSA